MKFTFKAEGDRRTIVYTCDGVYLPDLLEHIESFLRGSGFFFDGHVDIHEEEDEVATDDTSDPSAEYMMPDTQWVGVDGGYVGSWETRPTPDEQTEVVE